MPRMRFLTYATDESKMTFLNLPGVVNLGKGRAWTGNYKDKLVAVRDYIANLPSNDIVCFVDGYDTVSFLDDDAEALRATFEAQNADILLSAETNCYPWHHVASLYLTVLGLYRYLNSGGYMGYVWALQKMLSLDMSQAPCDQGFLTYVYVNYVHDARSPMKQMRIKLDGSCTIFQTAYGIPWSHFCVERRRLHNRVERTRPVFLHFNGNYHLQKDGTSIMPAVYRLSQGGHATPQEFPPSSQMRFTVICDDQGVPNGNILGQMASQGENLANAAASHVAVEEEGPRDKDIVELATQMAALYVAPDQGRIMDRDQVNHHAIIQNNRFVADVSEKTVAREFVCNSRRIVEHYFKRVGSRNPLKLDVLLHDYVGRNDNNARWTHSILGFSKDKGDPHNVLIPDLYAMQDYKGMLGEKHVDNFPTLKKRNHMLFIGSSTGPVNVATNPRIRFCRFVKDKDWCDGYISSVVHFEPEQEAEFCDLMHRPMSLAEQHTYRHIAVIDGHTACWDRLPWVLASKCVCWKQESDDTCWYYPFLKPWVHYIPFDIDDLEEMEATWNRVKNDHALQLRIVFNANTFVEEFLTPHAHALYTRTLLDGIAEQNPCAT